MRAQSTSRETSAPPPSRPRGRTITLGQRGVDACRGRHRPAPAPPGGRRHDASAAWFRASAWRSSSRPNGTSASASGGTATSPNSRARERARTRCHFRPGQRYDLQPARREGSSRTRIVRRLGRHRQRSVPCHGSARARFCNAAGPAAGGSLTQPQARRSASIRVASSREPDPRRSRPVAMERKIGVHRRPSMKIERACPSSRVHSQEGTDEGRTEPVRRRHRRIDSRLPMKIERGLPVVTGASGGLRPRFPPSRDLPRSSGRWPSPAGGGVRRGETLRACGIGTAASCLGGRNIGEAARVGCTLVVAGCVDGFSRQPPPPDRRSRDLPRSGRLPERPRPPAGGAPAGRLGGGREPDRRERSSPLTPGPDRQCRGARWMAPAKLRLKGFPSATCG